MPARKNKKLKRDKRNPGIPKILVLGTNDAGKSTIVKQLRIIHKDTFSPEECLKVKETIIRSVVNNIKILIDQAKSANFDLASVQEHVECLAQQEISDSTSSSSYWNEKLAERIRQLWKSQAIQKAFRKRDQFHMEDGAAYFLDNVTRIGSSNYEPTQQDIIRTREKTVDAHEFLLQSEDGAKIIVIDVGGDKEERKKWEEHYETVVSVLFVASLSEYNQTLAENGTINRMHESLEVFHQVCNNEYFWSLPMILFLNKMDLFVEKLSSTGLNVCFEGYKGGSSEAALKFVEQAFLSKNENPKRGVFAYATCATDTNLVKKLFFTIRNSILQRSIEALGFE